MPIIKNTITVRLIEKRTKKSSMKYIHTMQFKDDDYEIATATAQEEVKQLGIAGFVKYDEMKGMHFYRKPKKFRRLA